MTAKKRNPPSNRKRSRGGTEPYTEGNQSPRRRKDKKSDDFARSQLRIAGGILVVAILVGVLWNNYWDSTDPLVRQFWSQICKTSADCAPYVATTRRTLQAARPLRRGEVIAEISREALIWDVDALRDDFVQSELLFKAQHSRTNNPLPAASYLAAYLALQLVNLTAIENPTRRAYLEMLPNRTQLSDHPILWDREELLNELGAHSWNFGVALMYREMVDSEYHALNTVSEAFARRISKLDYTVARILVLTRSFSPGPDAFGSDEISADEQKSYETRLGMNFSKGGNVMVPILDMLNHHPKPNVAYAYEKSKRAFVIRATQSIPAHWELMDSYGKFSDNHLFARYGFVNGDGSGYTQASIALFHRNLDFGVSDEFSALPRDGEAFPLLQSIQWKDLRYYLQYDDGYSDCIKGPDDEAVPPEAFELKRLKLRHLLYMANQAPRWILNFPPRSPLVQPAESTQQPIKERPPEFDPERLRLDISPVVETCRFLSLIHTDFDGEAVNVLKENLSNPDFVVKPGNEALEYRALMCVVRLSSTAVMQYEAKLNEEITNVAELNREAFQSRQWTAAHLRLGEIQSLQALSGICFQHARQLQARIPEPPPAEFTIRERSCPADYSKSLEEVAPKFVTE